MVTVFDRTNFDVNKARPGGRDWEDLDKAVQRQFAVRAPLTSWLIENGLIANFTEQAESPSPLCIPTFVEGSLPLPFTHHDTPVGDYSVEAVSLSARRVAEQIETLLIQGWDGNTDKRLKITGILSHPKLESTSICWNDAKNGDVGFSLMKRRLEEKKFYGGYCLAVSCRIFWDDDHEEFPWLKGVVEVYPQLHVTPKELWPVRQVLFQATTDVIRVVVALKPTVVEWDNHLKVICCMVPQIREDANGNFGITSCVVTK